MEKARNVHDKLLMGKRKLGIAESCTGGLLLATLTQFPGASDYLLGGVVSYSNELKESMLHVSSETLKKYGAVSRECAIEMANGIFKVTQAEIAISVTGILGPSGGSVEKPVGTVWMAIGLKDQKIEAHLISLRPNQTRTEYRNAVIDHLLEALWNL